MKRIFVFTLVLLLSVFSNSLIVAFAHEFSKTDDTVLMCINTVASSDSDFDQYIKNEVAAVCYNCIVDLFEKNSVHDISEAVSVVKENIGSVRTVCAEKIKSEGCTDSVIVEILQTEKETYSTMERLNNIYYPTVRIVIGDGLGESNRKFIEREKPSNNDIEEYSFSKNVFPAEVKFDFWIVNAIKKLIASFE